jgi:type III secretory pathway component EscV
MKIASLVFFVMLAVMALLGSVLLDQSAQTARELAQVKQELAQLKQTQTSQVPQVLPKAEPLVQRLEKDKKTGLRNENLQKEGVRLTALEESLKLEKLRIQKTQLQIDAEKQQLDTDEKSLDLEMLTAVLENRLQKRLNTLVAATTATATPVQPQSNAPVKGADQHGELPYRPVPVSVQQVQAPQADNHAVAQITARKNSVMEDRKKLWARQRSLDEDKQKLAQAAEQLKHQRLELVSAMKTAGVKPP